MKCLKKKFQGEFLYYIFTTVLHATNKSDGKNEWNLERETTTQLDGQKADWENYFIVEKEKADTLSNEITKTDKGIDRMVYELYGLSGDEIKVIEES